MAAEDIAAMIIMKHDAKEIKKIIDSGIKDYVKLLENVATDVYDSCIQDYYAKYTPTVYKRHGNIEGFNLYQANDIEADDFILSIETDSSKLTPYRTRSDIREAVLQNVMNGIRGLEVRTKTKIQWPSEWITSYPNRYSLYGSTWSSSCSTINSILDDFAANVLEDTYDILWNLIAKYV